MSKIMTNGTLTKCMRLARQSVEDVNSMDDQSVIEGLILIKKLQKNLEESYSLLEESALKREIPVTYVPEQEFKVLIKEGNFKSEYDTVKIGMSIPLNKFVKIVNVVDSKAKAELTEEEYKIVEANKKTIPSEKRILSVSKMTKQELVEHRI